MTALINAGVLAREEPAVYVLEDVHWIDEASESLLSDFMAVIPQTPSLVLITYRTEYHRALSRLSGAHTITLSPLSDAYASALIAELLGTDPSLGELAIQVATRADGNPFFAEEMVRDLAERGVLQGQPGAYLLRGDIDDVDVPATLQATIGDRIDRLDPITKRTLNAAAVIGSRFDADLLTALVDNAEVAPLIEAELLDQVRITPRAEYAFRHPLIRMVAYESQLKSDRAPLHRRLAAAIEARGSADENAALIAEHLEAAVDLHADTGTIRTDLVGFANEVTGYLATPLGRTLVRAMAVADDDATLAAGRAEFWQSRLDLARAMIDRAVARGELPADIDPATVLELVIAPLHFRALLTRQPVDEQTIDHLIDVLLNGLAR